MSTAESLSDLQRLADDLEASLEFSPIAEDGKVVVECGDTPDSQALHDCEAGSIHDGEILIGKRLPDHPGRFEIGDSNRLNSSYTRAQRLPEAFRRIPVQPVPQEQPGLDQNMVCRYERLPGAEDCFCSCVTRITTVGRRIPCRGINEQTHRL